MRKNKKKRQSNAFVFPVPYAGVVVLVATLALAYVWLGCRYESLGARIVALEKEKQAADEGYYREKSKWVRMKSPLNIESALIAHGLIMHVPKTDQVVWLKDSDVVDEQMTEGGGAVLQFAKLERAMADEGK